MEHIFVFGSNLAGRHGKGAALHARKNLGTPLDNVQDMWSKDRWVSGNKPSLDYPAIVALHKVKSCFEVAEEFNCNFGTVCKIWRKHGLRGKNFHA